MCLNGAEVVTVSGGSHYGPFTKMRLDSISEAARRNGGVYLYANQMGADGDRLYYDGSAMIAVNEQIVAQGSRFSLEGVEVVTATIDLDQVHAYRSATSRSIQATMVPEYPRVHTDDSWPEFTLSAGNELDVELAPSTPIRLRIHSPEEEIALVAGAYLWHYLRRCDAAGYLVPLSGGIDSCATAVAVFSMCRLAIEACEAGNETVIADVQRIARYSERLPKTPQELCNQILHTVYMGVKAHSSKETRSRAQELSKAIGSHHIDTDVGDVFDAHRSLIANALGFEPQFKVHGGSAAENITLQNIQARSRMVTAYSFAQILPTVRQRPGGGSLLVLGSTNVGESLRGIFTKYDCSAADLNPIGSMDKSDVKNFIAWAEKSFNLPCLSKFLTAIPTAELEPITEAHVQSDEKDMGMTYDELTTFGRLRKGHKAGPVAMFTRLVRDWGDRCTPREVAEKVKRFFHCYNINRHKLTVLTPALHVSDYSPDDNRFDPRPFLYPPLYSSYPAKKIDEMVEEMEKR